LYNLFTGNYLPEGEYALLSNTSIEAYRDRNFEFRAIVKSHR